MKATTQRRRSIMKIASLINSPSQSPSPRLSKRACPWFHEEKRALESPFCIDNFNALPTGDIEEKENICELILSSRFNVPSESNAKVGSTISELPILARMPLRACIRNSVDHQKTTLERGTTTKTPEIQKLGELTAQADSKSVASDQASERRVDSELPQIPNPTIEPATDQSRKNQDKQQIPSQSIHSANNIPSLKPIVRVIPANAANLTALRHTLLVPMSSALPVSKTTLLANTSSSTTSSLQQHQQFSIVLVRKRKVGAEPLQQQSQFQHIPQHQHQQQQRPQQQQPLTQRLTTTTKPSNLVITQVNRTPAGAAAGTGQVCLGGGGGGAGKFKLHVQKKLRLTSKPAGQVQSKPEVKNALVYLF